MASGAARALFAGGCFWGVEHYFEKQPGVLAVTSGYAGGSTSQPTYRQVGGGDTGHAEVVRVEYDPSQITYEQLLDVFWQEHDPTTPNRQGPDVGSQYRSMILFQDKEQERIAQKSKAKQASRIRRPIVTEIVPATAFYPAEDYHQSYLEKRGRVRCNR